VQAALRGSPGIAYGNIVGSNIANILLIVGVAALITPILVASSALRRDGAVMVAVAAVFAAVALAMPMGRLVGLVFVAALAVYIYLAFRQERTAVPEHGAVYEKAQATQGADPALDPGRPVAAPVWLSLLTAVAGLAVVVGGGYLLVTGAVALARSFGISETVIGLTIVAVGTSMPELVTSVMAALRRETDVAFGNIVGSNIYNILGIGGVTALVAPAAVPVEIARFDNPIMIGVSLVLVSLAWTGGVISRREGALLLAGYVAYVWLLWP
jgi:cation:H+ antiporter